MLKHASWKANNDELWGQLRQGYFSNAHDEIHLHSQASSNNSQAGGGLLIIKWTWLTK